MPSGTCTSFCFFFFNDTATTEIYTLSLHDALPICWHLAEFSVHRTMADPGRMAQGTPWRGTSAAGRGGVLIDHGTHLVYQLLDIAGLPTSVSAWTGRLRHAAYEVEGTASFRVEYPGRL